MVSDRPRRKRREWCTDHRGSSGSAPHRILRPRGTSATDGIAPEMMVGKWGRGRVSCALHPETRVNLDGLGAVGGLEGGRRCRAPDQLFACKKESPDAQNSAPLFAMTRLGRERGCTTGAAPAFPQCEVIGGGIGRLVSFPGLANSRRRGPLRREPDRGQSGRVRRPDVTRSLLKRQTRADGGAQQRQSSRPEIWGGGQGMDRIRADRPPTKL